ncbi:AAA family ATPase [Okibacterium endophyticum]
MIVERMRVPASLTKPRVWPWTVPAVAALIGDGVSLTHPVTFLVGENGSGKSTIVEGVAEAWGVDVRGGHSGRRYSSELERSALGETLTLDRGSAGSGMVRTKAKGFFLRSETALDVFDRLQYGDDYVAVSHGESFLQAFDDWFVQKGLYLLDEPEAALSFTACLRLIGTFTDVVEAGGQVICATHSPLLTAMPGAQILELDEDGIRETSWGDLALVQHWQRFMQAPERYLRHL